MKVVGRLGWDEELLLVKGGARFLIDQDSGPGSTKTEQEVVTPLPFFFLPSNFQQTGNGLGSASRSQSELTAATIDGIISWQYCAVQDM